MRPVACQAERRRRFPLGPRLGRSQPVHDAEDGATPIGAAEGAPGEILAVGLGPADTALLRLALCGRHWLRLAATPSCARILCEYSLPDLLIVAPRWRPGWDKNAGDLPCDLPSPIFPAAGLARVAAGASAVAAAGGEQTARSLAAWVERQLARHREAEHAFHVRHLDGGTGLPDDPAFWRLLAGQWRRGVQTSMPLALVLVRLNEPERYRLAYGDAGMEAVMATLAGLLRRVALHFPRAICTRHGNDSLAMLLPGYMDDTGRNVLAMLNHAVFRAVLPHLRARFSDRVALLGTVSAARPRAGHDPAALVDECEAKLAQMQPGAMPAVMV